MGISDNLNKLKKVNKNYLVNLQIFKVLLLLKNHKYKIRITKIKAHQVISKAKSTHKLVNLKMYKVNSKILINRQIKMDKSILLNLNLL